VAQEQPEQRGAGPILGFDEATWAAFLAAVKRGEFDGA
jgi:hypothetical protein